MGAIGVVGVSVPVAAVTTWAGRPSAVGVAGRVIRITDVGSTAAGTFWVSDGTRWHPHGRQRIFSSVADIALAGATSVAEQKAAGLLLPAGLIGAGYEIDVTILDTYSNSANNKVLRVRLGSADDLTGTAYLTGTTTTTATAQNGCKIRTTTASANAQLGYAVSVSTPFGNSSAAVMTDTLNMSNASYLVISGQCVNAADTLTIKAYTVDIAR